MGIKVILAEDHTLMREGLRALLEKHPDIGVVGEAETGREAVGLAGSCRPDIVIMDVSMPDLNGIDATGRIMERENPPKVIALSMHADRRFVERMLQAGASGYLLKNCAARELVFAIREVAGGRLYLSPGIAGGVVRTYLAHLGERDRAQKSELTAREREIVQLIAEGRATKRIAEMLNLSPKTVESHRRRIMEKLNLSGLAELTKYAIREGLTELGA